MADAKETGRITRETQAFHRELAMGGVTISGGRAIGEPFDSSYLEVDDHRKLDEIVSSVKPEVVFVLNGRLVGTREQRRKITRRVQQAVPPITESDTEASIRSLSAFKTGQVIEGHIRVREVTDLEKEDKENLDKSSDPDEVLVTDDCSDLKPYETLKPRDPELTRAYFPRPEEDEFGKQSYNQE